MQTWCPLGLKIFRKTPQIDVLIQNDEVLIKNEVLNQNEDSIQFEVLIQNDEVLIQKWSFESKWRFESKWSFESKWGF